MFLQDKRHSSGWSGPFPNEVRVNSDLGEGKTFRNPEKRALEKGYLHKIVRH